MQYLSAFVFTLLSFFGASVAMAQTNTELIDLAKPVLDAAMSGNYMYAVALMLVLSVALVRRFGGARWPILASKKVAPFLVMVGSFGAALATSLGAGASISGAMLWGAVKIATVAAGGYSLLKPLLDALQKRAPKWAQPLFGMVGWIFSSRDRAERAKAAGQKAVKENPAQGLPKNFTDVE